MSYLPPQTCWDFYKSGHRKQYNPGTTRVYSNLTARSGKHSNIEGGTGICFVGLQMFIRDYLINDWNDNFFSQPKDEVVGLYEGVVSQGLGYDVPVEHLEELHDLGYLPLDIKSLPEGTFVPYGVPCLSIVNTKDKFFWLTNTIETVMSSELWGVITSATTTRRYLKVFQEFADLTGSPADFVPFQAHDFSFRGMMGRHAAALSSLGALLSGSQGTDTIPGIVAAKEFYGPKDEFVAGSVNATEHSVMCSYLDEIRGDEAEIESLRHLINVVHPTGILSIVCDTWDFWKVVTVYLPLLKDDIMARDGKVVIRPDSGDPVEILTGNFRGNTTSHEERGLVECLWDIFGGTKTSTGHRLLDSHIGCIYGDAITLERQWLILHRLSVNSFASANVVLGVGSYSYTMVTRDTHGMAVKGTEIVNNGKSVEIFKAPKTDLDGTKKSLRGLFRVYRDDEGNLKVKDRCTQEEERGGLLRTVFLNGVAHNLQTVAEVRAEAAEGPDK